MLNVSTFLALIILSHGRDGHLRIWQLKATEESSFSTALPVEGEEGHRKEPWLLHSLQVNTLNFCSFDSCEVAAHDENNDAPQHRRPNLLIAVVSVDDDRVDIWELPAEKRVYSIPAPPQIKKDRVGMIMTIRLLNVNGTLYCVTGHESGLAAVRGFDRSSNTWATTYLSRPHSQPILSLDVQPSSEELMFFTSGADATLAAHRPGKAIDGDAKETDPTRVVNTKHSGQQSLTVRSDGKILATAGWDGRVRVYSTKTLKELAVLKWHKEGCYATAFSQILSDDGMIGEDERESVTELTHTEGNERKISLEIKAEDKGKQATINSQSNGAIVGLSVKQRREEKIKRTHWIAAGSKDGKISLWEIY